MSPDRRGRRGVCRERSRENGEVSSDLRGVRLRAPPIAGVDEGVEELGGAVADDPKTARICGQSVPDFVTCGSGKFLGRQMDLE